MQSCAASVLLWAITSEGRWTCSIAKAIVAVLPEPVTPSSVWKRSPFLDALSQAVASLGLVGDGAVGGVYREVGHNFETSASAGSLESGMAVVIASALDKDIAGSPLFRSVSFKLERGDRMTLAGRNGAGKTTLLRMIAGQTSVDGGELVFEKGTRTALHDQRPPRERDLTLRDYVLAGCGDLVALEEELRALELRMAQGEDVMGAYARAQARLEHAGGWDWRVRAIGPLHGLGFRDEQLDRPLDSFSGGELTRASLARALAGDPALLLLDEPTNHLDIASLEWLEGYLTGLDAAVVLVAHDRWFLEAVGTSVLELEAGRARFFPGPWHAWRRESAARDIALGKAIEKQQREIARMERFVERFRYKATKARQAQSRVKKLDKMERIERDPRTLARSAFASARPSAPAAWCSSWTTAGSRCPGGRCSRTASCGSSAPSTCRWWAPTGWARPRSSRPWPGAASSRAGGCAAGTT